MRCKFCDITGKRTYLDLCQECGKLTATEHDDMHVLTCPHLYERVTFIGPYTDKWRQRFGKGPEPPVGTEEKAYFDLTQEIYSSS